MSVHGTLARLVLCLPILLASGCGAADYRYVKNSDAGLYLKVPRDWGVIDTEQLQTQVSGDATTTEGKQSRARAWHAAFDAATNPSINNVFAAGRPDPIAWIFVRDVPAVERAALSLNSMRDLVLPLGQAVANEAASEAGFEILMDTELNPQKGLYGRRTVFKFKVDGVSQTVDQTVMTNDRHSKLYYLVVRCTTQCFDARHDELTKVVKSLTIKG